MNGNNEVITFVGTATPEPRNLAASRIFERLRRVFNAPYRVEMVRIDNGARSPKAAPSSKDEILFVQLLAGLGTQQKKARKQEALFDGVKPETAADIAGIEYEIERLEKK
jgi:hypothetical protein